MLNLISPPALEPVTTVEMKAHLRIDDVSEDAVLADYITTARETIERRTGLALINQTWLLTLDSWPDCDIVELPRSPLVSVLSIDIFDAAGAPNTLGGVEQYMRLSGEGITLCPNRGGWEFSGHQSVRYPH